MSGDLMMRDDRPARAGRQVTITHKRTGLAMNEQTGRSDDFSARSHNARADTERPQSVLDHLRGLQESDLDEPALLDAAVA